MGVRPTHFRPFSVLSFREIPTLSREGQHDGGWEDVFLNVTFWGNVGNASIQQRGPTYIVTFWGRRYEDEA